MEVNGNAGWTKVPNSVIHHEGLSVESKMVLIYLLSKPEGWQVTHTDLVRYTGFGRNKVKEMVSLLEAFGFLTRTQGRNPDGTLAQGIITVNKSLLQIPTVARFTGDRKSTPNKDYIEIIKERYIGKAQETEEPSKKMNTQEAIQPTLFGDQENQSVAKEAVVNVALAPQSRFKVGFPCYADGSLRKSLIVYVTDDFYDSLCKDFPKVNVASELTKASIWLKTKGTDKAKKTKRGIPAFLSKWLLRASESGSRFSQVEKGNPFADELGFNVRSEYWRAEILDAIASVPIQDDVIQILNRITKKKNFELTRSEILFLKDGVDQGVLPRSLFKEITHT